MTDGHQPTARFDRGSFAAITCALLLTIAAAGAGPAEAKTIKLCFRYDADFADAGVGEDYWTEPVAAREARGARVKVIRDSKLVGSLSPTLFDGFLDDGLGAQGAGCTPPLTVPSGKARYVFHLSSQGRIAGNDLVVYDYDASPPAPVTWITAALTLSPGTWAVDLGPPPGSAGNVFNVYQATAFSLYRHSGALSKAGGWRAYAVRSGPAAECGAGSCYSGGAVFISSGGHNYKFIIAHELGHELGGVANPALNDNLCTAIQGHALCPESGCSKGACATHSMLGYELSKCALGEGFADFYSVDVWNDHAETDCWLKYWKREPLDTSSLTPLVNCEDDAANAEFPVGFFDLACRSQEAASCSGYAPGCVDGRAATEGVATELDWLRQLWNVHTKNSRPSFDEMIRWLSATPRWGAQDAYPKLDTQANQSTTPAALRNNWNQYKGLNAVDQ